VTKIIGYKGFDKNWKCRDFQYEVGKTYVHDGDAVLCGSGFHFCEAPLDVWNYYDIGGNNKFALVEADDVAKSKKEGDTKRCAKSITIKAALTIPALISAQIEWTFKQAGKGKKTKKDDAVMAASGYYSNLAASGGSSNLAASGYYSKLAASGDFSNLAASGGSSNLAASGYYSKLAASGDFSNLAASGDFSNLAASGESSNLAASGYSSKLAASGDFSNLAASGGSSNLAASGKKSIAMAANTKCTAKAGEDGAIALAWWNNEEKRYRIAVGYVGENGIKADVWYYVENGKLAEVK